MPVRTCRAAAGTRRPSAPRATVAECRVELAGARIAREREHALTLRHESVAGDDEPAIVLRGDRIRGCPPFVGAVSTMPCAPKLGSTAPLRRYRTTAIASRPRRLMPASMRLPSRWIASAWPTSTTRRARVNATPRPRTGAWPWAPSTSVALTSTRRIDRARDTTIHRTEPAPDLPASRACGRSSNQPTRNPPKRALYIYGR